MNSVHKKLQGSKNFKDKVFTENMSDNIETISTGVISLNLLHSGRVKGGIQKGAMNMISADSSLGKSFIGLSTLKNAQDEGMECIVVDSEKSFDYDWAKSIGIDCSAGKLTVIRESMTIELEKLFSELSEGKTLAEKQNTFILLDSWGTLVTHVILKKASEGSDKADMSEAKWKNKLSNIMKYTDMTFYVVNHVYDNTGGFGDPTCIPGGKRLYFNSETVVLGASKRKDKKGTDITGAIVGAICRKGRKSIENLKLEYRIKHDGGLDPWFGILPLALEGEYVVKPTNGYYSRPCVKDDKKWRESELYCADFWIPIFKETDLVEFMEKQCAFRGREIEVSKGDVTKLF